MTEMEPKKKPTYAEALAELEGIVAAIESDRVDVDHLTEQVKRAHFLIDYCKEKLRNAEEGVKKVLSEMEVESVKGELAEEVPLQEEIDDDDNNDEDGPGSGLF